VKSEEEADMPDDETAATVGDGWAVGSLDALGEGPGFRKIRRELDVKEFGVNAVVLPAGYATGFHFHDQQEELYFIHAGEVEVEFGDGTIHRLGPGGLVRVDAPVQRKVRNVGEGDATYVAVGAKGGYVGRDGHVPDGESRVDGPPGAAGGGPSH
jgi:mannose-6-phosphate isomerase-like protein (cupin superfamily)